MDEKLMQEFIQWLPQNIEEFANKSPEEIITAINTLSQSEDGVKMLQQLMTAFQQSKSSNSFKLGGKIEAAVNKFQQGGLTRRQALKNYMMNNKGTTRSQARQAYRNAKLVGKSNMFTDPSHNAHYENHRDWARQLISGQTANLTEPEIPATTNSNVPKVSTTPINNPMNTVIRPKPIDIQKPVVETNHNGIDLSHGSFNDAFAAARRQGLDTFRWNGGLYGTKLRDEIQAQNPKTTTPDPEHEIIPTRNGPVSARSNYYGSMSSNTPRSINSIVPVTSTIGGAQNIPETHENQIWNPLDSLNENMVYQYSSVGSPQSEYSITANTSRFSHPKVPVSYPMRGSRGRYSMAFQDGGKFDPYYGPLKVTDEGYFDVDGREVVYEEPRIKQWINARNERKRLENDALSEAGFGKGIRLDTFNNKPWESIKRGVHRGGMYTPADTILIQQLDNGKLQRENAKSLKTLISRKLFGDSKFDQINREFENE